jgi:hypothetical protein
VNAQPTPEAVAAVADEITGIEIGGGYYSLSIGSGEAREAATAALAFIRDAIHRDGPDADAIRETLGLTAEHKGGVSWSFKYSKEPGNVPVIHRTPVERRVVGPWQEVGK